MRLQGRITKWNDERGFGFITSSEGGDSVFIHISSLRQSDRRPSVNESVSYTLGFDSHGRPQANDVQFMVVRNSGPPMNQSPVSYTHLRAHETPEHLVCRLLL